MAKFSYTQNGIFFNNLDNAPEPIKPVGGKLFNTNNDYEHATKDGIKMAIDAVTIDWNGAQIANTTVNTTGELLAIINDLYGKVNNAKVSSIQLSYTSTWEPTWVSSETTLTVYAYVYPDNAYNKDVQWECINAHTVSGGNNELITFDSAYESYTTITLKDYGTGTVRCTAQDGSGVYGQFNIDAHPPVQDPGVSGNTITATLLYGEGVHGGSEYVTPAQIEKAREFTNISVNLTSLDNYHEFRCPGYTTSHSLIIRLPYSESNIPTNIYPNDVRFKDTNLDWRPIGYLNGGQDNKQQIKTHYTSTYSYFVITSYAPNNTSDYCLNFTKVKPNYGNVLPDPT